MRIVHRAEGAAGSCDHAQRRRGARQVEQALAAWPGGGAGEPDELAPEAAQREPYGDGRPVGEGPALVADEDRRQDDRPERDQLERAGDAGGEQYREQQQPGKGDDDQLRCRQAEQYAAP
ncbi:hypothetical protein QFZ22_004741 [Streptomyces canus]|uniref:Uncharacterized protein n=1 Tax=Streptomyces canus TaxID=58343 RepID=A0AAW8FHR4_9ACTN|nr:hypothetical protein [Streptomyces canus]